MSRANQIQADAHLDEDTALDVALGLGGRDVRSHLHGCPPCAELVRQAAASRERTRAAGRLRRRADGGLELDRDVPAGGQHLPRRWFSAAAVAAVAAALAWMFTSPTSQLQLPVYQLPTDVATLTRSASSDDFTAGLELYRQGRFEESAGRFEAVVVDPESRALRNLYLASALTLGGGHEQAVVLLERLQGEHLPAPWYNRARWTLYRALLGSGRVERAEALLQRLTGEADEIGDLARREAAARSH